LGLNDYLTTALPNLSQTSRSNLIQLKKNKTMKWFETISAEEQTKVVDLAVKKTMFVADSSRKEAAERDEQRCQNLKRSHSRREALKRKQLAELSQHHLISSSEELLSCISEIDSRKLTATRKRSQKLEIVQTQIKIRKKNLKQNINIAIRKTETPQ